MPEDLLELEAETPVEPEIPELADDQPEGEQAEESNEEGEKPPVTSLFQPDGKKLDPQVSKTLSQIKTENPDLGKLLTRAVYRVAEMDREFPGGLTEVREMRDKVEELGGLSGIEQKLESVQELDGLAQQFMSADPAFVEDMATSSPESFAALAPHVFQKFSELNPDAYGAYIGRVVYGDMQQSGLPLMLMRLSDLVADKPQAAEALAAINTYLGGFKTLAEKQVAAPKPTSKPAGKETDLSKREEALRSKEWQTERDAAQRSIVNSEYTRLLAGRTPDSEEKAQIRELFLVRSKSAADRLFPGWEQKSQRYIASGDKSGYLRYIQSIYKRVVPEAMASSVASTMKGKKAAPVAKKPAAATHKATPAATPGFSPVANEPSSWDVDYGRTSQAMLRENRAILKDGKKVTWK